MFELRLDYTSNAPSFPASEHLMSSLRRQEWDSDMKRLKMREVTILRQELIELGIGYGYSLRILGGFEGIVNSTRYLKRLKTRGLGKG